LLLAGRRRHLAPFPAPRVKMYGAKLLRSVPHRPGAARRAVFANRKAAALILAALIRRPRVWKEKTEVESEAAHCQRPCLIVARLSRLAAFSNCLAFLRITFIALLVHLMLTAPRLKEQRRCEGPLSASSTQSTVFRPAKRSQIDCVDYRERLYSPPSQDLAVINQSQFSPAV